MKHFRLFWVLFVLAGCYNNETNQAKQEVILYNDVTSYLYLVNNFDKDENLHELLPYSLKMQKVGLGYYDFYNNYLIIKFGKGFNSNQINSLDKREKDFLLLILEKGALQNDYDCKELLIKYYKEGLIVPLNLQKSDSIYKTFDYPNER